MTDSKTATELDSCEAIRLDGVEVQENGIIRDARGWIIGRADNEWMRYQWRMLESGICPCCGRNAHAKRVRGEGEGRMSGPINALFGGQPENLEYVGYTECPICGYGIAEVWRDETGGKEYTRCPFTGCDGWGELVEMEASE